MLTKAAVPVGIAISKRPDAQTPKSCRRPQRTPRFSPRTNKI